MLFRSETSRQINRNALDLPGYGSIKSIAVDLASSLSLSLDRRVPTRTRRTYWPSAVSAARLITQKVPLFFIAADLLTAIRQTTPPKNVEWAEMHLPFENAVFVLPRGSVRHQMYGDVHQFLISSGFNFLHSCSRDKGVNPLRVRATY